MKKKLLQTTKLIFLQKTYFEVKIMCETQEGAKTPLYNKSECMKR